MTDKDLLRAYRKQPSAETFRPFLDGYQAFVHAAARRQTLTEQQAEEITRATFLAFAKRAGSLSRKTPMAGWLHRATCLAARKVRKTSKSNEPASGSLRRSLLDRQSGPENWLYLAPLVDTEIGRLSLKLQDALLDHFCSDQSLEDTARTLGIREALARKRVAEGIHKLGRRVGKRGLALDDETLASLCTALVNKAFVPEHLALEILAAIPLRRTRGPAFALTSSTLGALTCAKWKRRLKLALTGVGLLVLLLGPLAGGVYLAYQRGPLLAYHWEWTMWRQKRKVPFLAQPARSWPSDPENTLSNVVKIRTADDLFVVTNIWRAHLKFSSEQWKAVSPKRIGQLPPSADAGGKVPVEHGIARRHGMSGKIGYQFDWAHAALEFGDVTFPDIAARIKGNSTFLLSLWGLKRSFKADLGRFGTGQKLGGVDEVNFTNLIEDRSYMADALGYEFFRDCGVPAPRTSYAYLDLSVAGQFENKPLGLYLVVENMDGTFAKHAFGTKSAPIFKPDTEKLFEDIGDDWGAYAYTYDLKTKASGAQQHRVVEFAKLISHADDAEFARRLGEFLDLDAFARFLGALTLIASCDGFLSNGQNFYAYLDPRSNKFGFIPWDLDHAWGNFPGVGTQETRERASIWHPWVGDNRFMERVMAVEEFRHVYRERLEELLRTQFTPEHLNPRIDEIAASIRDAVGAESTFRKARFEEAVSDKMIPRWRGNPFDPRRTGHQLKRFIANRSGSVRKQLDGKTKGMVLDRNY